MRFARPFLSVMNNRFALSCAMTVLLFLQTNAQERLIIVGGGKRPTAAMAKFVEWAGKERAHILVVPWATSEPQASFDYLKKDLTAFKPKEIELAPIAPLTEEKKARFLNQLKNATGVFFTGGDQVRIMEVLKDESLLTALKQRYSGGVVFGGTSAGAAIMSSQMITGEGDFTVIDGKKVQTARGLGLTRQFARSARRPQRADQDDERFRLRSRLRALYERRFAAEKVKRQKIFKTENRVNFD